MFNEVSSSVQAGGKWGISGEILRLKDNLSENIYTILDLTWGGCENETLGLWQESNAPALTVKIQWDIPVTGS